MIKDARKDLEDIRANESRRSKQIMATKHALQFHLMPPVGWLNDPNGLCECDGVFHIFFQYSPKNANGGEKYWGHYTTKDFIEYEYTGPFMSPDNELDRDGVYSGSALAENGEMIIYYTGNVKEDGDHDYTYSGRLSNTVLVRTKDGSWTDEKMPVLVNRDYPEGLSCHIRDPKVFRDNSGYKMILGARTRDDVGCALIYSSKDKLSWSFVSFINSKNTFGFMWECPDIITLEDQHFLSISPQGVEKEEFRYQNVYQSGYFKLIADSYEIDDGVPFSEWDMGFDFYAPQTFKDSKGRQILIGWMGIPDADYTNEPTVKDGWQHTLTMARELYIAEDGKIAQRPIAEYEALTDKRLEVKENSCEFEGPAKIICEGTGQSDFCIRINQSLSISYDAGQGVMALKFDEEGKDNANAAQGYGRTIRKAKAGKVTGLTIYLDNSAVEIYTDDGKTVLSSRYYCDGKKRQIDLSGVKQAEVYSLKAFKINS
ncbi:MAG: glycoside hydrolase family 32 protein [Saccharofermentans sp.]|nr:glycoside hydrolase family 32 protein [Saccharofermentans sp.]